MFALCLPESWFAVRHHFLSKSAIPLSERNHYFYIGDDIRYTSVERISLLFGKVYLCPFLRVVHFIFP